ncbi:MAG: hypothetical protein KAH01_04810 [Caldisericia bacterium]|nr:hypothetical protein [Caldisericia bacterium]
MSQLTPAGNPKLFHRKEIKASFMQFGYGQQEKGTKHQLEEDMEGKYNDEIYDVFMQAVDDIVPGFSQIMEFVNGQWNKNWEVVTWKLPDDVLVQCKPTSSNWEDFRILDMFDVKAKVSGVRKEKFSLILFVGIIHSLDAYIARQVIERCNFDVLTIHDAFRCHPNNAHIMQQHYKEILADINNIELFQNILEQITGQQVSPIVGNLRTSDIMQSKYAIC